MSKIGFGKKLYIGSLGIIVLTIFLIAAVNFYQSRKAFLQKGKVSIENVAEALNQSMELKYNLQQKAMDSDLSLLESKGSESGVQIVESRTADMTLVDRKTGEASKETLPKMIFGLTFVTGEYETVDAVGLSTDSEIAVYQFYKDKLVKVSSSLKNEDGSRNVGEYFSPSSQVYQELMADRTHMALLNNDGRLCMQVFKPFRETADNAIAGAYSVRSVVLTSDVINLVESLKVSGKGYSFVAGPDGKILAHPDKDYLGTSVTGFENGDTIVKTSKGPISYKDNGTRYYAFVDHFDKWALTFGVAVSEPELIEGMNRQILISSSISGSLALIIGVVIIMFMNRQLMANMGGMATLAKEVADGNFKHTFVYEANDAIRETVDAMNEMVGGLARMIAELNQGVDTLSHSSGELNQIAEDMNKGSRTTVDKLNTVASAAEEMSVNMDSVAAAMEQASTNVETVAEGASDMNKSIENVSSNSIKTRDVTKKAVAQAEKASGRISQLGKAAEEINKVTDTINNISSQTNLLALNATIEAARAGDAGKGFAIVANEIKDLASQTAGATQDIAQNIQAIQEEITGTVTEIKQISDIISQIDTFVSEAAVAIESQSETTGNIAANISQVSQGIQEVNENINQSSSMSGQVAMDISEVLEASEKINALSESVKERADVLNGVMQQLQSLTGRFRI